MTESPPTPRMNGCELTILMPCLNEAETLGICIQKASDYLTSRRIEAEVLIADNGSTDGSRDIARDLGARVIPVEERGYGNALIAGIGEAQGRYVIMGDADDSYDFTNLDPFIDRLRCGFHLVMGNRFKGGIEKGAMPFLNRYLGNPTLSFVGRLFFGSNTGDFHCGLRGFDKQAIQRLGLKSGGMEFASEMVGKATLKNLRSSEVPTTLSPDGRSRRPHLRRWRDGWRHLRFLLLFSPEWLFLYPGLFFMGLGLVSMIRILMRPVVIGSLSFDVNTLVYCAAAIVGGFQLVVFSIFAKILAMNFDLLPEDHGMRRFQNVLRLEVGVISGFSLVMVGLVVSLYAVRFWGEASFGDLDPQVSLRIVVPAATAMVLGIQVASSSFFLSVLNLNRSS
ncbi:MAG: glycosyltransferase family 2 protein [Gemmatimonadetes bacterium]|nr:glycosyltransferase family 2 protein [Gemmatimonadota bacterium]